MKRGQKKGIIAPRGAAKSTRVSLAYPLYCAFHGLERYIIITSDSGPQAKQFLANIRDEVENNELLKEHYPDLAKPGPVWRDDSLRLANGVQIDALGTGGKIRGRRYGVHRPSLIIVDDPQNLDHIISVVQRERSWNWLNKDVCNAGDPQTNYLVLGTALHRECIVCKLQQTAGWEHQLFRALEAWPERMDLWTEWENLFCDWQDDDREETAKNFYEKNKSEMDRGAVVLWPERFPLYDLMVKKVSEGIGAFNTEQQGHPVDPSQSEWPEEYFTHPQFWFEEWPEDLEVKTMALDPSKGKSDKKGDWQAWVMYGRDRKGVEYIEADLRRQDTSAMLDTGVELMRRFKPDGVFIEANVWQELLAPPFSEKLRQARLDVTIYAKENHAAKEVRIRRLTSPLSTRKMRFKRRSAGTAELVQQAKDFPQGAYDDGLDCVEMARRLAIELFNERHG